MKLLKKISSRFNYVDVCYQTLRLDYWFIGYPRYSELELKRDICKINNPEYEIAYFKQFSQYLQPSQAVVVVMTSLVLLKNILFPIYTLSAVDTLRSQYSHLGDIKSNLNRSALIQYGCLWTNCSRLSNENKFFDDIVSIPVYKLCHPYMRKYTYPFLDNDIAGIALQSVTTYFVFIFAIITPIVLYLKPLNHEVGLFVIAPKTLHHLNCEVAREYLLDRLRSIENYYFNSKQKIPNLVLDKSSGKQVSPLAPEELQRVHLSKDYTLLHKNVQDFVEDCIPMGRSLEFQWQMAKQYLVFLLYSSYYFSLWITGTVLVSELISRAREVTLKQMDSYIQSSRCSIWKYSNTYNESSPQQVKLFDSKLLWNPYTAIEYLFLYSTTGYLMITTCAMTFNGFQEIYMELSQQKDRIQIAIDITYELLALKIARRSRTKGWDLELNADDDIFKRLRKMHFNSIKTILGIAYLEAFRDQKIKTGAKRERFLLQELSKDLILRHGPNLDVYLNVLVKVYVGTRVLARLIRRASYNVSFILMYCYMCNYGCALMVGYLIKRFLANDYGIFVLGAIAFLLTNTMVAICAEIQAKSKRLMSQIWQLIAVTRSFEDHRIQHMRTLLIKQVVALTYENGMPYKMLNVNITYETLIEIIICSTTLALLSIN